jgi:hypothetical protein
MQEVARLLVHKQAIQANKSLKPFNLRQSLLTCPGTLQVRIKLTLEALVKVYGFTLLVACQWHLLVVVLFLPLDRLQT